METIVALASAQGKAGVSLIRMSGPHAFVCAEEMIGSVPKPWSAKLCDILGPDGEFIDQSIVIGFKSPKSFTCLLYTSPSPRDS